VVDLTTPELETLAKNRLEQFLRGPIREPRKLVEVIEALAGPDFKITVEGPGYLELRQKRGEF
jgi:hypothetical protein